MTQYRPTLKNRLPSGKLSEAAIAIVDEWKQKKIAAPSIVRAILLYACLLRGDVPEFHRLLAEWFPGYGLTLGNGTSMPTPRTAKPATITFVEQPEEMKIEAALSSGGFDELEF